MYKRQLLLLLGPAAAALGLAAGLLLQGALFAPIDLPQYGMNVTTLLAPLLLIAALAQKIIPAPVSYTHLGVYKRQLLWRETK